MKRVAWTFFLVSAATIILIAAGYLMSTS